MVEHHLVKVGYGGSSPLFPATYCISTPPWWNGRHSGLKIRVLLVQARQGVLLRTTATSYFDTTIGPGDGMVDVLDLGSSFWEFKSPPGHPARLVEW